MIFTNRANLPEAVVAAVRNDPYNKGDADFSVTELLKPSRQRALQKRHKLDIVEDVSDRLWSLLGQLGHGLLERAGLPNDITEVRFKAEFNGEGRSSKTWTVSAQVDSLALAMKTLTDYKFTTAYKFLADKPVPDDYTWQLNMQKRIIEKQPNPPEISQMQIVGFIRDWQIRKAEEDARYPQVPIAVMPIPVLPASMVEGYILGRIESHLEAEEKLPRCSSEETWKGRRCKSYCNVNQFCEQYQKRVT